MQTLQSILHLDYWTAWVMVDKQIIDIEMEFKTWYQNGS